jgi:hypothetical protein
MLNDGNVAKTSYKIAFLGAQNETLSLVLVLIDQRAYPTT